MIHPLDDFALENLLQLFEIHNHPRNRIRFTRDRNLQRVVVPVTVRVIAFAKNPLVLLRAQCRVVIQVRSRKLDFARQINHVFATGLMLRGPLSDIVSLSIPAYPSYGSGKKPTTLRQTATCPECHKR